MTIDQIEEMIKKYLSTGIAVVVVLIAPGTRSGDPVAPSASLPPGSQVITVEPDRAGSTATTAGSAGAATGTGDRTGAAGTDPGSASTPDGRGPAATSGARPSGSGADQKSGSDTSGTAGSQDGATSGSPSDGEEPASGTDGSAGGSGSSDRTGRSGNGNPGTGGTEDSGNGSGSHAGSSDSSADSPDPGHSGTTGNAGDAATSGNGTGTTGQAAPPAGDGSTQPTAGDGTTAAAKLGWGAPNREDDFSNGAGQWGVYDGAGHGGQGKRSPSAVSTTGGVLTITGDSSGTTAGMAWLGGPTKAGQKYGRWEGRVKAPASDPSYNALLLLWPDAENWPTGGEVDFMEMSDSSRQETNMFLHYGADNQQTNGKVQIDATQWHNWALEWTPDAITAYVDGQEWYRTTDKNTFPPGPMHLCIQLDWFPQGGSAKESTMQVDWVRQYPVDGSTSGGGSAGNGKSTGSGSASDRQSGSDQQSGGDGNAADNGGDSPVHNVLRRMFSWG